MATQKSAVRGALTSTQPSPAANHPLAEAEEAATPYSQALSRLEPLQPVLTGLAHRNHNQHRRAAWWRSFGLLRRNCARLVEHLIAAVAAARKDAARAAKAAKAQSKKRRREELVSGSLGTGDLSAVGTGVDVATDVNVTRHANWLRNVLIPKCYLAFSQLTADSQFAPIGVVLLSILAQVQAACDCAAPRSAAAATLEPSLSAREIPAVSAGPKSNVENTTSFPIAENAMALPASGSKSQTNDTKKVPRGERDASAAGGGKAISRKDVERAAELREKGKGVERAQQRGKLEREIKPTTITTVTSSEKSITLSRATKATSPASSSKRQVVSAQDGGEPEVVRPVKKMKTAQVPREREDGKRNDKDSKDKEKKKKKKAKKGDEFDDLFKGLF
ncbi:hypothetical protein GGS24DRAFT_437841 [Hypoxylon argillaceum]|nr:hypothetical protein GGS24DRAFT_437841 [Hypoxylon argillaceum]